MILTTVDAHAQIARAIVHHAIDCRCDEHAAAIRLLARAHAAALAGRSFNRSLAALSRWSHYPNPMKEPHP